MTGALLVETAQYIPASTNAVNRISDILYMRVLRGADCAGGVYALALGYEGCGKFFSESSNFVCREASNHLFHRDLRAASPEPLLVT